MKKRKRRKSKCIYSISNSTFNFFNFFHQMYLRGTYEVHLEYVHLECGQQSTGAKENFQMLMGLNDTDLLVSTFMNDISVISFEKINKFNNETKKYENYYKFKRNGQKLNYYIIF